MQARRQRVVVYAECQDGLLVFEHRDHPGAGTKVPAGGLLPGESLAAAAEREVLEETGVSLVAEPTLLGAHEHVDSHGRPALSHLFRVVAPAGLPDRWEHTVTGHGEDMELVVGCRFDPAPPLWPVQSEFWRAPGGDARWATRRS